MSLILHSDPTIFTPTYHQIPQDEERHEQQENSPFITTRTATPMLGNMPRITTLPGPYRRLWTIGVSIAGGAIFGTTAQRIIESIPTETASTSPLWLLNHLTSGTWLWAVVASASTWLGMRQSQQSGWRRYLESFLLCLGFLSATTIAWYGPLTPVGQLPLLAATALALCTLPSAGIAVVGAFAQSPGVKGLLSRLCLPLGLALILLVAPPPPVEHGGNAAAEILVWQVLMGANVGLVAIILSHFLLVRRGKESTSTSLR